VAASRRFGRARCVKAPVEFGLDERGIFDQADDLLPDDLVEQILADWSAVAYRAAEVAPGIRTKTPVIMDFARRAAGRRPRQRIAAFAA
jgi:hypothetical protein